MKSDDSIWTGKNVRDAGQNGELGVGDNEFKVDVKLNDSQFNFLGVYNAEDGRWIAVNFGSDESDITDTRRVGHKFSKGGGGILSKISSSPYVSIPYLD